MNMKQNDSIAILGGGNIGKAMLNGFLRSGKYSPGQLIITRRNKNMLDDLKKKGTRTGMSNAEAVREARMVILAVQPRQMKGLLEEIHPHLDIKGHLLISVVTGFSIQEMIDVLGDNYNIVRAMPNTGAAINESMTCLAARDRNVSFLPLAGDLFDLLGTTLVINERLMSAATILGACGIAYFLRYIRAASQGGIQVGFHADEAQIIAAQTARAAASLLLQSGHHPEQEIDKVTTPRGCTITGLNEMEHHGLSSAIIKGIVTSFKEIEELR